MGDYIKKEREFMAQTYTRHPIMIIEASGIMVRDTKGRSYIDCFSGIAVNNVGHCNPKVVAAICNQAQKLIHTSNIYYTKPQLDLSKMLHKISGGYQSFFCNSGAEANEAAIKLVRKFTGKGEIIAAENSFHGRTLATLQATGQQKYKQGFDPLPEGFKHIPYGDAGAIEESITSNTAAILLEPIQGEGGIIVPPENYLHEVAAICRKREVLLVLDEVQTGFGRTGAMFAWQDSEIEPDIFTVAKALGGGMPIGAMLAKKSIMSAFGRGDHASTFGGNPVATAAALATINIILEDNLVGRARDMGQRLSKGLKELKKKYPFIKDIRGKGLMIGVELDFSCKEIIETAMDKGLLLNSVHERILRFTPPLTIDNTVTDDILRILDEVFAEARHD